MYQSLDLISKNVYTCKTLTRALNNNMMMIILNEIQNAFVIYLQMSLALMFYLMQSHPDMFTRVSHRNHFQIKQLSVGQRDQLEPVVKSVWGIPSP